MLCEFHENNLMVAVWMQECVETTLNNAVSLVCQDKVIVRRTIRKNIGLVRNDLNKTMGSSK